MRWIISIMIIIFLVGCTTTMVDNTNEKVQQTSQDDVKTIPPKPVDQTPTEPVATENNSEDDLAPPSEDQPAEAEDLKCNFDADPQELNAIVVDFEGDDFKRNADGFTFQFYPVDENGNVMVVEGNLGITVYNTEIFNGERRSARIVYQQQVYVKTKDADPKTCAPKPITINFEDVEKDSRYIDIADGDPGQIKLIFKRTGSFDEFEKTFLPESGQWFLPQ